MPDNRMLSGFVERIARVMDERDGLAEDIREILIEAEEADFSKKAVKQMVKEYRMDAEQRAAHAVVWETCDQYRAALGMLAGTPLGTAAEARRHDA